MPSLTTIILFAFAAVFLYTGFRGIQGKEIAVIANASIRSDCAAWLERWAALPDDTDSLSKGGRLLSLPG